MMVGWRRLVLIGLGYWRKGKTLSGLDWSLVDGSDWPAPIRLCSVGLTGIRSYTSQQDFGPVSLGVGNFNGVIHFIHLPSTERNHDLTRDGLFVFYLFLCQFKSIFSSNLDRICVSTYQNHDLALCRISPNMNSSA